MSEEAIKIFYSYAREDRPLRDALDKQLSPLRRAKQIETWHDLELEPGSEWEKDLLARLEAADIILLLISADFMDSEYCYSTEMGLAIDRHDAGQARVIPVILRPCDWNHAFVPFSKLNVLPTDARPVVSWPNPDEAYAIVARQVRQTVEQMRTEKQKLIEEAQRAAQKATELALAKPARLEQKLEREQGQRFGFTAVRINLQGEIIQQIEKQARCWTLQLDENVDLEMVYVPGGSFSMGSNELEWEQPIHRVTVPAFHLGKYPVTQAQYQTVMGRNPSRFKGNDRYPVEGVSWQKAIEFCDKLSAQTGRTFTLPSEAQWEYACRAGTDTAFAYGETISTDLANYSGNYVYGNGKGGVYLGKVTPVGNYSPNDWGLYDMHGNVWEWCLDDWHSGYENAPVDGSAWVDENSENTIKLMRGGSWNNNPSYCRSAARNYFNLDNDYIGFRVMCEAPRTL